MRTGGIEPPTPAWKAEVLPLNYIRMYILTLLLLFAVLIYCAFYLYWKAEEYQRRRELHYERLLNYIRIFT